ncbi:MAG: alpha/beta hydrolase [Pseudomonadota bacterium]
MSYVANRHEGRPDAPLFLTFHGTGGTEDQFHSFARDLLPDAQVVSPRGDVSEGGALRFFRRTGEGIYDMEDLARRTQTMAAFIAAEKARTGANRTIGLGYSNGANILASVVLTNPELVDDVVLLHPLIPWDPKPQAGLSGRRILITAGRHDPICPPERTEALARYLVSQGAETRLEWHSGGHEIRQEEITAIAKALGPQTV